MAVNKTSSAAVTLPPPPPRAAPAPVAKAAAIAPAAKPLGYPSTSSFQPAILKPRALASVPRATPSAAPRPGSFDAQVRGQGARKVDLDLMKLSSAAYDPKAKVDGWTRLTDAQVQAKGINPALLENKANGFRAGLYTDGQGHVALAFAGTNDVKDVKADIEQGVGLRDSQYDEAVRLGQQASRAFGDNLVMTGHSLGGGLAATAAAASGRGAVTFNAAGVNDNTLRRYGLDPATVKAQADAGQMRRYNIKGEALTGAQEDVPGLREKLPDALGHEIRLNDPAPPQAPKWTWNPVEMAKRVAQYAKEKLERPIQLHLGDSLLQALQQQHPWAP